MPPKVKVTKKMVAQGSFEVIRAKGHENLNARTVSEYLGCSTQPVLYSFKTMDEIRQAAYEIADEYHTMFIMPKETDENPMLALGLNYVRFGQEEKNLFRFLFQTNQFGGKDISALFSDPGLSGIMGIMAAGLGVELEKARELFLMFFCVAHGMASLLANNSMEYDEEQCRKMLENVYVFGTGTIASGADPVRKGV
ncbi:MAG: WHG domain-containing protein [Lachnospiraceae bacterium]|nr:WHG domain-containing protein [Lachnospiraceae bacterium]